MHRCPQQEQLPTSLLKLSTENTGRAIKMFNAILKYQSEGGDSPERLELIQKLLHQGLKRGELRDELFMQLLKQTRANPSVASRARGWELLFLVASTMAPSKDFVGLVSQYIHDTAHDAGWPWVVVRKRVCGCGDGKGVACCLWLGCTAVCGWCVCG